MVSTPHSEGAVARQLMALLIEFRVSASCLNVLLASLLFVSIPIYIDFSRLVLTTREPTQVYLEGDVKEAALSVWFIVSSDQEACPAADYLLSLCASCFKIPAQASLIIVLEAFDQSLV